MKHQRRGQVGKSRHRRARTQKKRDKRINVRRLARGGIRV